MRGPHHYLPESPEVACPTEGEEQLGFLQQRSIWSPSWGARFYVNEIPGKDMFTQNGFRIILCSPILISFQILLPSRENSREISNCSMYLLHPHPKYLKNQKFNGYLIQTSYSFLPPLWSFVLNCGCFSLENNNLILLTCKVFFFILIIVLSFCFKN